MEALVPLMFVILCSTAVLIVLDRTLRTHEREADAAYERLEAERMVILDESESYLLALRATPKQSAEVQDVDRDTNGDRDTATDPWELLRRAREADNPEEAARLDDELLESIERSRRSRNGDAAALERRHHSLLLTHAEASQARTIYNNRATTCNNEASSFPVNLLARRRRYRRRALYEPHAAAGTLEDAQCATHETLAEETRIMNAYMLWAVSLSGTTLDVDRPRSAS